MITIWRLQKRDSMGSFDLVEEHFFLSEEAAKKSNGLEDCTDWVQYEDNENIQKQDVTEVEPISDNEEEDFDYTWILKKITISE